MQEFPYPCCAVFFDFPGGSVVEGSICSARDTGDMGSITKVGTSQEKESTTPSSILACKILWTEELGKLQFKELHMSE